MSKTSRTTRGDLMRRIAAIYAKLGTPGRGRVTPQERLEEREELKKQIEDLTRQMMAL
jgi:hypothetical protein